MAAVKLCLTNIQNGLPLPKGAVMRKTNISIHFLEQILPKESKYATNLTVSLHISLKIQNGRR